MFTFFDSVVQYKRKEAKAMFSKNLKFYRLRKQMSKKELANKAKVTSMAITNYEKGDRKPSMEILQALAAALGVHVSDFLAVRNEDIIFAHGENPAFLRVLKIIKSCLNVFADLCVIFSCRFFPLT